MQNEKTAASVLFGNDKPAAAPSTGTLVTGLDLNAPARQTATPTARSGQASDSTAASVMFGPVDVEAAVDTRDADLYDTLGATEKQRTEIKDTFVGIAKGSGLLQGLVASITAAYLDAELAAARATDRKAHAEQVESQAVKDSRAARAGLRLRYGATEAEAVLTRTERFVSAHPALSKALGAHGLGSRPEIIAAIAHHVYKNGLGR